MIRYNNIEKTFFNCRTHMRFSSLFHNIGVIEKVEKTVLGLRVLGKLIPRIFVNTIASRHLLGALKCMMI